MVNRIKFAKCKLDTRKPYIERLVDSFFCLLLNASLYLLAFYIHLQLFSVFVAEAHIARDSSSEAPASDTEHFSAFDTAIIHNGDIARSTTDIDKDRRKAATRVRS